MTDIMKRVGKTTGLGYDTHYTKEESIHFILQSFSGYTSVPSVGQEYNMGTMADKSITAGGYREAEKHLLVSCRKRYVCTDKNHRTYEFNKSLIEVVIKIIDEDLADRIALGAL